MKQVPLCIALILGSAVPLAVCAQELAADTPPAQAAVMEPAKPDPAAVAAKVTKAVQATPGGAARDVTVSTHAAIVVLTGEVNSEEAKVAVTAAAEKAAEGTRISNNIEVRAAEDRPAKDQQAALQSTQLVRDVEAALKADTRTANLGVAVTSADGKLVLQGLVPSRDSRTAVQNVASRVKGVTQVDNRLQIPGD